jgi:hypothetical protein
LNEREDRRRRRVPARPDETESRHEGPRTPPTLRFSPGATGCAVFTGVAIPIVIVGYTRASGVNVTIIVIGIAIGIVAGVIAAAWVAARGGRIWKGPQL